MYRCSHGAFKWVFGWVYKVTSKFNKRWFTIIHFEIKLFFNDWVIFNKTINLHDHNYDTPFCNIRKVKPIIYTPSFIWTIDLLLHLWSFMSLLKFILYLFQWELKLFTENVSKIARGDNKICLWKFKYTKVYNFDRFSQLPFQSKRKHQVC